MEQEIDFLTSSILLQKVCSHKYQFCTKVCASSRLVSQVQMMAGQNIKKEYLVCQITIKIVKHYFIIKFAHQKGAEKLVKDDLRVCS